MNETKQALEAVVGLVGRWMQSGGTDHDAYQEGCEQAFRLIRDHGPQLAQALEDARRYNALKPTMTAANFHPEDPDGLDLGEGVALIFMLPKGTAVYSNLDTIIDALTAGEQA